MNEEHFGYFSFGVMILSVIAIFIGCLAIRKGTTFWVTKLMFIGSLLLLSGTFLMLILIYGDLSNTFIIHDFFGFILTGLFLLGLLLFFIGFFGFCARWGASGRRRAELLEITAALAAAQSANSHH